MEIASTILKANRIFSFTGINRWVSRTIPTMIHVDARTVSADDKMKENAEEKM